MVQLDSSWVGKSPRDADCTNGNGQWRRMFRETMWAEDGVQIWRWFALPLSWRMPDGHCALQSVKYQELTDVVYRVAGRLLE